MSKKLCVSSPAFQNNEQIPIEYTGRGEDVSPELHLEVVDMDAVSIAIVMDDIDHPLFGVFNHWCIWNIAPTTNIHSAIPHGKEVPSLGNAKQGRGYGKHCYRGPKPPFGTHRYEFCVYVLDCLLDLPTKTNKKMLLKAMEGHILQTGSLIGKFT